MIRLSDREKSLMLMIYLLVSTQYTNVTDRQTDTAQRYSCGEHTECKTARLAEALLTTRGRCATASRWEAYRSFDAERLVEDVTQQVRAVRADYAVGGRL